MKAACSRSSLTSLSLTNYCDSSPTSGQDAYAISNDSMRLFFGFENLRDITIMAPLGLDLDDVTITDMTCAWPRATNLSFKSFASYKRPRLTFNRLHAISRHCPGLVQLEIALDASFISTTNVDVSIPRRCTVPHFRHLSSSR
ncbi:hypothetical protein C8R44DRAFT_882209 [Mycena epipterygia]|nr:hypothetical protein C8R44DRAFT_882209 [Mycena epipterygia]